MDNNYNSEMLKPTDPKKERSVSCRLYADEYDMFVEACRMNGKIKSDVLRTFVRNYIRETGKNIVQVETGEQR